jgi:nucleotide-binding universal stress UspA family protein
MLTLTRIVRPVDLSETSWRAPGYATALAKWYKADLPPLIVGDGVVAHRRPEGR